MVLVVVVVLVVVLLLLLLQLLALCEGGAVARGVANGVHAGFSAVPRDLGLVTHSVLPLQFQLLVDHRPVQDVPAASSQRGRDRGLAKVPAKVLHHKELLKE